MCSGTRVPCSESRQPYLKPSEVAAGESEKRVSMLTSIQPFSPLAAPSLHVSDNGWISSGEAITTKGWKCIRYTDNAARFERVYHVQKHPFENENPGGKPDWARQRHSETWREQWTVPI